MYTNPEVLKDFINSKAIKSVRRMLVATNKSIIKWQVIVSGEYYIGHDPNSSECALCKYSDLAAGNYVEGCDVCPLGIYVGICGGSNGNNPWSKDAEQWFDTSLNHKVMYKKSAKNMLQTLHEVQTILSDNINKRKRK